MRVFACLLAMITAVAAASAAGDDADRLRRLVAGLASPDFRERETATQELDRAGEVALEPLRQAAKTTDPETRQRAVALVERISRRQAGARVLAPTLVTLNYDHVPLAEAVADLARRTDMSIAVHGSAAAVAGRTVTLFADKATAWQAVQLFCHQAGLHQWDGFSASAARSNAPSTLVCGASARSATANDGMQVLGQMQVRRGQISAMTVQSSSTARIVLIDGPGPALPTHEAGSVRIRAAPPGVPFPAELGKDVVLVLQISAEARLYVDGAIDLRIDRAIDEQGRERTGRPVWTDPPDDRDDWPRGFRPPPQITDRKHGPVAIRFERDDSPPKRLRELAGVATIQPFVIGPNVEIDRPAAAIGKTVRNGDVALSLLSIIHHSGNKVRIAAEVQLPYGTRLEQPVTGLIGFPGRGGFGGRGWAGFVPDEPEPATVTGDEYQGVSVADAAGRRFTVTSGATEIVGLFPQHYTVRITAHYQAPAQTALPAGEAEKGGAEPAKVAFAVRRPTTVEVPFVLRDVPLP